ncbi:hypothetical protein PVL29_023592 [Vitis rotundifolia]|uniref:Uncharacterized protein n=1 Tax=Vitis rotundifolia TaxID=103349 RepID=A0AA38YP89_VITRO|nr:hypothetical protein PVL29_023592 [Vitis rotundifolia]
MVFSWKVKSTTFFIELGKSIMLRQSPSRNQRSKGFKLKPVLQICVLLAICIWLLYQVKHFEKVGSGHEIMRLGRKDLHPELVEEGLENERHGEGKEDPEDEEEESRAEENGDEARGAGDDEMDGRDQDRLEEEEESEQGEDFVDEEEDKDREEGSER